MSDRGKGLLFAVGFSLAAWSIIAWVVWEATT
jgi:hypothetical protein